MTRRTRPTAGVTLLLTLGILCTLTACGTSSDGDGTYDVSVRWTSYGIPHVKAADWGSLGYGFAYAIAEDAVCVIAKDIVMVNGRLAEFFGADDGRLESDVFHRAILTTQRLSDYSDAQTERAHEFSRGYVAGYNRYLADHEAELPASCAGEPWVAEITADDVSRLAIGVGIRYGLGRFQKEIAHASPIEEAVTVADTQWELPEGIGSNAVAVGRGLSESGRGILLGNPHYPWHGSSRFHLVHTTIPGEVDVMGTSLLNTNRVSIGFNKDIAWTHTVSTAMRSTVYRLELDPADPYSYVYDGETKALDRRTVEVQTKRDDGTLETSDHTVYLSHFGPVIENEALPWNETHVYVLRDAVLDNFYSADTYAALNVASSTEEIEEAISRQGVFWVNTIAADRHGNAFYADISGTPNIDAELLELCRVDTPGVPGRVVVLDGGRSDCEWYVDDRSRVPGALPPDDMPRLVRDDYVTNSNDSYWLSNPQAPLEGYSPIIGQERSARSLRTRAGLVFMDELIDRGDKLSAADIQGMLYNHRNFGAELLLDDLLPLCGASDLEDLCAVLTAWDRTMRNESVGGHVWREIWDRARRIDDLWAVPFDASDPVGTPRGLNVASTAVASALREAMREAQSALTDAKIALDAPLGEIQYAERNGERIPIPGGEGWAGMFSMIVSRLAPEKGYTPIVHGNSYVQVISWDEDGNLDPRAILTYSQSPEPESAHYSDQTKIYSEGGWIRLPFTEEEIEADPNLRRLRLQS